MRTLICTPLVCRGLATSGCHSRAAAGSKHPTGQAERDRKVPEIW
jgi:hypothetical protein